MEHTINMFQDPMCPWDCLGIALTVLLTLGRIGVVIQYFRITGLWLEWYKKEEGAGKQAVWWLAWIFRFCASAGYGLLALTVFTPFFYYLVVVALILEIIASEIFLRLTRGVQFMASPKDIKVGRFMTNHIKGSAEEIIAKINAIEQGGRIA